MDISSKYVNVLQDSLFEGKYLFLLHNAKGRIKKIINTPGERFYHIEPEIRAAADLSRYFDFKALDRLSEVSFLTQFRRYKSHPFGDEIVTALPTTSLVTRKIGQDLYLGRISTHDFMPNLVVKTITGYLFADIQTDLLLGFNPFFYSLFKDRYPDPQRMLHRPLSNFFSPTPGEVQQKMAPAVGPPELSGAKPFFSRDLSEGLKEEASEWRAHVFTVPLPLNTLEEDFCATLAFTQFAGFGPYFILGEAYRKGGEGLDYDGYLLGRDAKTGRPLAKRASLAAFPGNPAPLGTGRHTLQLLKQGSALYLFEDRKGLLSYFDGDFLHRTQARLSVGLRFGYRCRLETFSVSRWAAKSAQEARRPLRHIAKLLNDRGTVLTLDRFYNAPLSDAPFFHVAGFLLNDVTEMQDKIQTLDTKYRKLLKAQRREEPLLTGEDARTQALREAAATAAGTGATVLIEGPTGAGKEVVARFIHAQSPRRQAPFIKVDCATVPSPLLESHLFGHEKGAFTGAVAQSIGMFEQAHGGTLFLDEVGNLSLEVQTKLLQFFNDFTVVRVGGNKPVPLDVRCILASNAPLRDLVRAGTFREDLYFRIHVIRLQVPALRERRGDIPLLSTRFLDEFNGQNGRTLKGFTPGALMKLEGYGWPGNVRELKNAVYRAAVFCRGDIIGPELLELGSGEPGPLGGRPVRRRRTPLRGSLTQRAAVEAALEKSLGVVVRAAEDLTIDRRTLYNYLKREKIDVNRFRQGFGGST